MTTTTAGASRGKRRARGWVSVVVAFLLAPVVVVAAVPVAEAAVTTTTAATVAARAAAPGVATLCAGGGPVTWTICGVGVAALAVGGIAYLTRDSWMPWLGREYEQFTRDLQGPGLQTISFSPAPVLNSDNRWAYDVTVENSSSFAGSTVGLRLVTTCISSGGSWSTGASDYAFGNVTPAQGSLEASFLACAPGQTLAQLSVIPTNPNNVNNSLSWTGPAGVTNAGEDATPAERAAADAAAAQMNFLTETTCKTAWGTELVPVQSSRAPVMPSCSERFGSGSYALETKVWGGMTSGAANLKYVDPYPQVLTYDVPTRYPDCATPGTCSLQVYYQGTPCTEGRVGCVAWTRGVQVNPGDYVCRFGPYTLAVAQCNPLERLYETGGGTLTGTGPNTDGDPLTSTPPGTQPAIGTPPTPVREQPPVSTPQPTPPATPTPTPTGTPAPGTAPNPNPDPLTNPGAPRPNPTAPPGPGTAVDPLAPGGAPGPGGDPLTDAGNSRCWPNGWGWFNPAEWVARPISCAFVPSPATQLRLSTAATDIQTKPPVGYVTAAAGFMDDLGNVQATCWQQSIDVGPFGTVSAIDTCTPGEVEKFVMQKRSLLAAVLWFTVLSGISFWAFREYALGSKGVA